MWQRGEHNGPADLAGVAVGHAHDAVARTGTTVIAFDAPAVASVSIVGQAPGTRDMALLDACRTVERIDALVLSGGSAFGLAAADPVMAHLAAHGRGFPAGDVRVPIVPAAILFDLANGASKPQDLAALYRRLGQQALGALTEAPALGGVGAGRGATVGGGGPGGFGMASSRITGDAPEALAGHHVVALVAVNAVGSPFTGGHHFRAAPFEREDEFGGFGPAPNADPSLAMKTLAAPGQNTTIGCLVTDVPLDKRACHSLAVAGQDGIALAIHPAHTALDGDLVVGASASAGGTSPAPADLALLQAVASATMARAIARGIWAAETTR